MHYGASLLMCTHTRPLSILRPEKDTKSVSRSSLTMVPVWTSVTYDKRKQYTLLERSPVRECLIMSFPGSRYLIGLENNKRKWRVSVWWGTCEGDSVMGYGVESGWEWRLCKILAWVNIRQNISFRPHQRENWLWKVVVTLRSFFALKESHGFKNESCRFDHFYVVRIVLYPIAPYV